MAYQRRMSGSAGPLSASGEASNGEPVQIELLINGEWVDITAYVMVRDDGGNISITRGRRDEGGTADHAVLNLLLDNRDGRWSPRNPTGTYYGLIGRNQPIRVSVPNGLGGKSYRFWGEVSTWPQMWDPTGTDIWVELEASGILRRLSQGPPSENSLIYDGITSPQLSGLRAYWPCEDPSDATEIKSALVNGSPMVSWTRPLTCPAPPCSVRALPCPCSAMRACRVVFRGTTRRVRLRSGSCCMCRRKAQGRISI
jgi:hypothetical protein